MHDLLNCIFIFSKSEFLIALSPENEKNVTQPGVSL